MVQEFPLTATSKLAELRSRTDRELAGYVRQRLELGLRLASAQSWRDAEAAYAESAHLLPVIDGLDLSELRLLHAELQHLREMLDSGEETPLLRAS
jgi:hypothetical protein